ncbi:MAG: hypothetical protein JWN96_286, partial [Mycobacterium sp.]|nr:hypothetical protein [Mycobacterium sp.]
AGYGPIPAPLARSLAADGKWRRLICDPLTGALIDLGTTVYKPNAEMERFIRSRDTRCTFPNCHQPAHHCDIDHTNPYRPGQPATGTDRCNLGCLCEYHHDLKHHAGWQLHRDPGDHTATWTSPTGHHYFNPHHDYRSAQAPERPNRPVDPPDDNELRWSDLILNDADWNAYEWTDQDRRNLQREVAVAASAPTATAIAAADDSDDQRPF